MVAKCLLILNRAGGFSHDYRQVIIIVLRHTPCINNVRELVIIVVTMARRGKTLGQGNYRFHTLDDQGGQERQDLTRNQDPFCSFSDGTRR